MRGNPHQGDDTHMIGRSLVFVMLIASAPDAWAADAIGDPIAGKAIFQHICQNCHSAEIGVNKVGPACGALLDAKRGLYRASSIQMR